MPALFPVAYYIAELAARVYAEVNSPLLRESLTLCPKCVAELCSTGKPFGSATECTNALVECARAGWDRAAVTAMVTEAASLLLRRACGEHTAQPGEPPPPAWQHVAPPLSPKRGSVDKEKEKEKEKSVASPTTTALSPVSEPLPLSYRQALIEYFIAADVTMLRSDFIVDLHLRGEPVPPRNQTPMSAFADLSALRRVMERSHFGDSAADPVVISHGWVSESSPDPGGDRLVTTVEHGGQDGGPLERGRVVFLCCCRCCCYCHG